MKSNPKSLRFKTKALFTIVGGAVLINPAFAQDAAQGGDTLEEIVVTGLRGSLKASMEVKRDAVGVVDAISAEDIGKFPDTNLAESLQRITGVSIDRRNGEGALVTARGFGPQYNLVTLNGRQMPGVDGGFSGGSDNGTSSRSFNFANLSADAISGVEVYKTGRADIATGGIGATVNVKTARPLDNDGFVFNLGAKAVDDTTNRVGSDVTPEVSGIFSYSSDDKRWGVGLNASYQKRHSGSTQATVNDWHIQEWGATEADNIAGGPFAPGAAIANAPAVGQLYGIPNDIRYAFSDMERERVNGQAVVQFAPIDALTFTLDYTYADNSIKEDRGEQTVWMQRNGFVAAEFDTGQTVATPVFLHEMTGQNKDFGYEQQHNEQATTLKSIGFNTQWQVNDSFKLGLDYHDSKAHSKPDDALTGGSSTVFSLAGKVPGDGTNCTTTNCNNFWTQTFQFNNGLPVAGRALYPNRDAARAGTGGNADYTFDQSTIGSQVMRIWYRDQTNEIKQGRLDGELAFDQGKIQFGVETRNMEAHQRTSDGYMALGDWGVADVGQNNGLFDLITPFSLTGAFDDYNPVGAPTGGWKGNANQLGLWGVEHYGNWNEATAPDGQLRYNPGMSNDNTIEEKTKAVYFQFVMQGELGTMPTNLAIGARYEKTDVTSTAVILVPTALLWQDDNDFQVQRPTDTTPFSEDADYDNLLPNLDFDIAITDTLKGRFSYSKTIARASYGQLAAGATVGGPGGSTLNGFQANATANNPALLPLESDNFDLSLEWYFSDTGYASVGFFEKRVANFIGNAVDDGTLYGIRDQTGGPDAEYVLSWLKTNNFATDDSSLFTALAMYRNPETGGLAAYNGTNAQHIAIATAYDILPTASDPEYVFGINRPVNNKEAKIHGWELGGQYFFGDTGFGVLANYTIVRGDVGYKNDSDPNENQFALSGLSDSANAVLMFEKWGFSARLAYNWRDKFLASVNRGTWRNPVYVAEHTQWDLSLGYDLNDHLSFSLEGINLTGEDLRTYGRSEKQLWYLEDDGARYALGARYKF